MHVSFYFGAVKGTSSHQSPSTLRQAGAVRQFTGLSLCPPVQVPFRENKTRCDEHISFYFGAVKGT